MATLMDLMMGRATQQLGQAGQSRMQLPAINLPPVQIPPAPLTFGRFTPNQFGNLAAPSPTMPMAQPDPVAPVPPIQSATSTTAPAAPGIFNRIFSGEDYQSNSMPVVMAPQGPGMTGAPLPQTVNWGDPENAADYFRAAAAAQRIGLL
jgi:hypothetical protein